MIGYTKLFSSIIFSTIWREKHETRIVWITMLAMRDRHHRVLASVPGLADAARVNIDECREALRVLESPDPDSRTPDSDGRRIEAIDGGWRIINGDKYRKMMNSDERREYVRKKVAEYRSRKNTQKKPKQPKSQKIEPEIKPPSGFDMFWAAYPSSTRKHSRTKCARKWIANDLEKETEAILAGLSAWAKSPDWTKDNGAFICAPEVFLNGRRWESMENQKPVDDKPLQKSKVVFT